MKVTATCEREFVVNCVIKEKRLDGRSLNSGRTLEIKFGEEWGCCIVSLGNTRVLSQVSAEVTEPKLVTPTEGSLHINLELSMTSADSGSVRNSDEYIETQRCLERCIRDSKCVDLESLCIVAGAKVWTIRVDVHGLNDDGNILECASIAAIASLSHFKRPDVTVVGTEVTEYSLDDREPVPLSLHHLPVIVNLALYKQGAQILVDPTFSEESISDGCYIIGINAHQEICFIHRSGILLLNENTVEKCEDVAIQRAQVITQAIRSALDDDGYKRATKAPVGFVEMLENSSILCTKYKVHEFDMNSITANEELTKTVDISDSEEINVEKKMNIDEKQSRRAAALKERALRIIQGDQQSVFEGGSSKWTVESEEETSEEETSVVEDSVLNQSKPISDEEELSVSAGTSYLKQELDLSSEEEIGIMEKDDVDVKPSTARKWYSKSPFS